MLELKMLYYYLLTEEELEAESNLYRVTELTHGLGHASRASCLHDGPSSGTATAMSIIVLHEN